MPSHAAMCAPRELLRGRRGRYFWQTATRLTDPTGSALRERIRDGIVKREAAARRARTFELRPSLRKHLRAVRLELPHRDCRQAPLVLCLHGAP